MSFLKFPEYIEIRKMNNRVMIFLVPASVVAGVVLNFSIVGKSANPSENGSIVTRSGLAPTDHDLVVAPDRVRPAPTPMSDDIYEEGTLSKEGELAIFELADGADTAEFTDLPKHGHDHGHGEFVVPERFQGLTTDEWVAMLPEKQGERLQRYRNDLASLDPDRRRFMCWAPGTPAEIVAGYRRVEVEGGLTPGEVQVKATQFLSPERWNETATNPSGSSGQGEPITVTWSIAPDETRVPGDNGSLGPSDFRVWIQGIYGGSATADPTTQSWFPLMEEAFNHLGDQSGLIFVYEPNDTGSSFSRAIDGELGIRGDIRISARNIDGNSGTLAFAYSPGYGDIVMDSTDNFFNNTGSNSRRFVNVLTHEIGHAIGLGHVCPIRETKLMEPFVTENFRGAQFDDIQSTQRQYGDALEVHDGNTDNDFAQTANDIGLVADVAYSKQWLSIDGNQDSDWFTFNAPANSRLTVRAVPASGSYLEGPQDFSCSSGTLFDPALKHDLVLRIFRNGGGSLVATRDATRLGGSEVLAGVQLLGEGQYWISVTGRPVSAAQLYRLEVLLESAPAGVDLQVVNTQLAAESNVGQNGNVDPGETVQLRVTLINNGTDGAQLVSGTLTGPEGFIDFGGPQTQEAIPSGLESDLVFTVSAEGQCGDRVDMTLELQSNGGMATHPIEVILGSAGGTKVEGFDFSSSLPSDWETSETGRGAFWTVATSRRVSPPHASFIAGPNRKGESYLVSPEMGVGASGGTLSFSHWYDLESARDGAKLEAQLDDGNWFDLLESAAGVSEGAYDKTIVTYAGSDIANEDAWSGNSRSFRGVSIQIPSDWAGSYIRFRWRLVSDSDGSSTGWWVDDISFATDFLACDPYLPMVSLSLSEGNLSERSSVDPLSLTLSTLLPLRYPVNLPLTLSGTADLDDLVGEPVAALGVGETESVFQLAARLDRLAEGGESLTLTTPETSSDYVLDGQSSYTVSVEDSEYSEWAGSEFEPGALLTGPDDDADGDGWSNVAEYLLGTDPEDSDSSPQTETVFGASTVGVLTSPTAIDRDDAEVRGETSTDLEAWTTEGVGEIPNGFEISHDGPTRFLRLVYEFLDAPEEP